jgi:dihydropteroate synthase
MLIPGHGKVKEALSFVFGKARLGVVRREFTLSLRDGRSLVLGRRTAVVGVLNVTPDSFSDGGVNYDAARAIERAFEIEAEGADILEVGGESTRPGAPPASLDVELARVLPVLGGISGRLRIPIAIDTYKTRVAQAALDLGASIINDVSALRFDEGLAPLAARESAALVLMHMRGEPATMQHVAPGTDIFHEIRADLSVAVARAVDAGMDRDLLIVDPGIGFGKTIEQNLEIINKLDRLHAFELPVMIGTSRKGFIGRLTGRTADQRAFGTAASVAAAIIRGAHIVRVHDVREMIDVARVTDAIVTNGS